MSKHKLHIAFVGLYDETNLGDPVIARCTEGLFLHHLHDSIEPTVKRINIDYAQKHPSLWLKLMYILRQAITKGWDEARKQKTWERIKVEAYTTYYMDQLRDIDLIVVVGGGIIKYSYQFFWGSLVALFEVAQDRQIPVILNSVGVEGYDENNWKCRLLQQSLHHPAIRYISTRDDIKTLTEKYFRHKPAIPCIKVADPAVWASEIFKCTKDKNSKVIGVGIIRERIFIDNGKKVSPDELQNIYIGIIRELYKQKYQVRMFTNGLVYDNMFARRIQVILQNQGINIPIDIPTAPEELVANISNYKAIIAGRLHSCIIAYSLDIPAIGLVWNDKLTLFGQNIDAESNFIQAEDMTVENVIKRFNIIVSDSYSYNKNTRLTFQNTIKESIKEIHHNYIIPYCTALDNAALGGGSPSRLQIWLSS